MTGRWPLLPCVALALAVCAPVPGIEPLAFGAQRGLALAALAEFQWSLVFAGLWLVTGRWLDLQLSHLGLPVLVWALEATLGTAARLRLGVPHALDFAEYVFEGLFALALVLGLVSLALGMARRHRVTLDALPGLAPAGVAVLTVVLDWSFVLLLIPALRD
jgi:hypothetical protein